MLLDHKTARYVLRLPQGLLLNTIHALQKTVLIVDPANLFLPDRQSQEGTSLNLNVMISFGRALQQTTFNVGHYSWGAYDDVRDFVSACVVTITVGGLSFLNIIAGSYGENPPFIGTAVKVIWPDWNEDSSFIGSLKSAIEVHIAEVFSGHSFNLNEIMLDNNTQLLPPIEEIPRNDYGAELVVVSVGVFPTLTKVLAHMKSGAKKVVASAASVDVSLSVVAINEKIHKSSMTIVSLFSCTTNGLVSLAKVILDGFVIYGLFIIGDVYMAVGIPLSRNFQPFIHICMMASVGQGYGLTETCLGIVFLSTEIILGKDEAVVYGSALEVKRKTLVTSVTPLDGNQSGKPGNHNFELLKKLVLHDGSVL